VSLVAVAWTVEREREIKAREQLDDGLQPDVGQTPPSVEPQLGDFVAVSPMDVVHLVRAPALSRLVVGRRHVNPEQVAILNAFELGEEPVAHGLRSAKSQVVIGGVGHGITFLVWRTIGWLGWRRPRLTREPFSPSRWVPRPFRNLPGSRSSRANLADV
jgi:hypothetical protein